MKKFLFLSLALLLSGTLSAQTKFIGTWSGSAVKNGQPMGFKLTLNKDGNFTMAYDLNPNDLSIKGTWSHANGVLTFISGKNKTTLKRQKKANKNNKTFVMDFNRKNKRAIYGFNIGMPPTVMFGWDEGVAAVVINHEEQ